MKRNTKITKGTIKDIEEKVYQSLTDGADFATGRRYGFEDERKWKSMTNTQKRNILLNALILVILAAGAFVYCYYSDVPWNYFAKMFLETENGFMKVVYYSIPRLFITICAVIFGFFAFTITKLINVSIKYSTQRKKTVGTLLFSIIKYGTVIGLAFWVLATWGVDTAGLVASAGILTLAIGLGAQSVIADLIAGLVIVIEGYIQVGDIVTFNGYKGTIREIGLRVTVIENINNDLEIVRNSEIRTITNNSKNISNNIIYFSVPNKVNSEFVEELMNKNLKAFQEESPYEMNNLKYLGLCKIENWGSTYSLSYECLENRAYQTERYLLKQIKKTLTDQGLYN